MHVVLIQLIFLALSMSAAMASCPEDLKSCSCDTKTSHLLTFNCQEALGAVEDVKSDLRLLSNRPSIGYDILLRLASYKLKDLEPNFFQGVPVNYLEMDLYVLENIDDSAFTGLEQSLRSMTLVYTKIEGIPTKAIKILKNIKTVKINQGHNITAVSADTFKEKENPGSMVYVDFTGNSIRTIESGSFTPLINLELLYLDGNYLSVFPASCLPASPNKIRIIMLSYNQFTHIPLDAMKRLKKGASMYLSSNNITNIDDEEMSTALAESARHIYLSLSGNLLNCSCAFKKYAASTDKYLYWYGKCNEPEALRFKNFKDLTVDDFKDCKN